MDNGLEFIPGIEISARAKNFELHLLGYFIDYNTESLVDYAIWALGKRFDPDLKKFFVSKNKANEYFMSLINDQNIECEFRYKTILGT